MHTSMMHLLSHVKYKELGERGKSKCSAHVKWKVTHRWMTTNKVFLLETPNSSLQLTAMLTFPRQQSDVTATAISSCLI